MDPAELPDPLQDVVGGVGRVPSRRARSIRRTASTDMTFVGGMGSQLRLTGVARDAVTAETGTPPIVVSRGTARLGIGPMRVVEEIEADPSPDGLGHLVGCRGGGHLRAVISEHLPEEVERGTPLHLLLDDVSGTSLIANYVWSRWTDGWDELTAGHRPSMEGVCIGFAPDSSGLAEFVGGEGIDRSQPVVSLVDPADPDGWHDVAPLTGPAMRRSRWIDVYRETGDDAPDDSPDGGRIVVESGFQDSATTRDGDLVAVHEYTLRATADPISLTLTSVEPTPRVLPWRSCTAAVDTSQRLVGTPLAALRTTVLERLARTHGCTHLNDALRALAEVPILLTALDATVAG